MMKSLKCFLIGAMIFLFFFQVMAQPEIGVLVGLNNSKLVGDGPPGGSYKYMMGFLGSAYIDFKLSEYVWLSFQPGFKREVPG